MGGALGGVFSNVGQGADGAPSLLQKLVQGTAAGAGKGLGQSMQRQPSPGGGGARLPAAPSATPVDYGYFAPTALPPRPGLPPGMMQPNNVPSPFYAAQ